MDLLPTVGTGPQGVAQLLPILSAGPGGAAQLTFLAIVDFHGTGGRREVVVSLGKWIRVRVGGA